jgi:putative ABC transport system ATP-binding protein
MRDGLLAISIGSPSASLIRAQAFCAGPCAKAKRTSVTMPSDQPAIEVIGLGRRDPKTAGWLIRDVSFAVNFGDRLGILGPSGAGKTVLLRALAMLDPLDSGAIHWRGQSVRGDAVPAYRKQVIYLHQRPALLEGSVEDNLRYPFTLKAHQPRSYDRRRAIDLLVSLGRDTAFLDKSSRDLSGGEAQIVAFVRAVQLEPAVLLLDEPTASLDAATAQALEAVLHGWLTARPDERALVWVSHDREQSLRMTGRRIAVHAGRLAVEE